MGGWELKGEGGVQTLSIKHGVLWYKIEQLNKKWGARKTTKNRPRILLILLSIRKVAVL